MDATGGLGAQRTQRIRPVRASEDRDLAGGGGDALNDQPGGEKRVLQRGTLGVWREAGVLFMCSPTPPSAPDLHRRCGRTNFGCPLTIPPAPAAVRRLSRHRVLDQVPLPRAEFVTRHPTSRRPMAGKQRAVSGITGPSDRTQPFLSRRLTRENERISMAIIYAAKSHTMLSTSPEAVFGFADRRSHSVPPAQ